MRQGVMATNTSAFAPTGRLAAATCAVSDGPRWAGVGCQYNGAAQLVSITGSRWRAACAVSATGISIRRETARPRLIVFGLSPFSVSFGVSGPESDH
jgi:hypothetical protein